MKRMSRLLVLLISPLRAGLGSIFSLSLSSLLFFSFTVFGSVCTELICTKPGEAVFLRRCGICLISSLSSFRLYSFTRLIWIIGIVGWFDIGIVIMGQIAEQRKLDKLSVYWFISFSSKFRLCV